MPSRLIPFPFKDQVLLSVPNSDMELLLRKREVSSDPCCITEKQWGCSLARWGRDKVVG